MAAASQGGAGFGAGGTGQGGAISSFGGSSTVSNVTADNSNAAVQTRDNFGNVFNQGEGSVVNFSGLDYGATAAATTLSLTALGLAGQSAHDSQITTRLLGAQAQETVAAQGAGALGMITKPLVWIVAIVATVLVLIVFSSKGKKSHAS